MNAPEEGRPRRNIIAELQSAYPDEHLAWAALKLTGEPVAIRRQFLEEYAALLREAVGDSGALEDPYKAAIDNVIYAASTGSGAQEYIDAWREAAPEGEHAFFGTHVPDDPEDAYIQGRYGLD